MAFFISSLFFLLTICTTTQGNVRLVCPEPISLQSDHESVTYFSQNTCDQDDTSSKNIMDVSPGLFTIRFEETKFQSNSPFRVTLIGDSKDIKLEEIKNGTNSTDSSGDETKYSCLLLDHIPHNNQAVVSKDCIEKGNGNPLGICNGSTYYITIMIPDLNCENCQLMLQQIITPQENKLCDLTQRNDTGNATDCIAVSSCANIRIRPTADGVNRNLSYCSNYLDNIPGDWPYRPQYLYKTDEGAKLVYDVLHKKLHIHIPDALKLGPVERVEIRKNISIIWNVTITEKQKISNSFSVTWEELSTFEVEELSRDQLVLNIVGSDKSLAGDIIHSGELFTGGKIGALHDEYSKSGWLVASKFLGPQAEDPIASIPAGPCVPKSSFYTAYLQSVHVTAHGILGMTVLENRAYITAVLHVEREQIETIVISGPALVGIPPIEIDVPPSFTGILHAAVDITKQLPYINTVKFLKTVSVKTDKEKNVLEGDLEEGMYAVLRDQRGRVRGLTEIQITQGQWLRVDVVLNDLAPSLQSAHLVGPSGNVLVDLSKETIHCTQLFCCIEAMLYHELSSEVLLHLLKGQAAIRVTSEGGNVTGNVVGSLLQYCGMVEGKCEDTRNKFSLNGIGVDQLVIGNGPGREWHQMETFILDRANVFQYCVQVDNRYWSGMNYSLELDSGGKVDTVPFTPVASLSHSFIACNQIPLNDQRLASDSVSIIVNGDTNINKGLPPVYRGNCIKSKTHNMGSDQYNWSADSETYQDIYAVVSDNLKIYLGENSTFYRMSSESDYQNCKFSKAKKLELQDSDKGIYYQTFTQPGKLYIADINTCNTSSPHKFTIHVAEKTSMEDDNRHDEWCRKSMYTVWRQGQLKTWHEPEVSGPILIGLLCPSSDKS
ncbi:uncharacterized protein LOC131942722 [Physella acuta]|uniref:uncharacterized protein LOC131942722 n=1 Tax=Physella acuta TaxID=109671 RepID=UPI0027DAC86C|nr:uncharacterized protein LOC131942722 [Physella acuta]